MPLSSVKDKLSCSYKGGEIYFYTYFKASTSVHVKECTMAVSQREFHSKDPSKRGLQEETKIPPGK